MPKAEFHFDYGSPNCYLAHLVIPEIEARTGVKFEYVPILLGGVFKATNNQAPMMAFKDITNKLNYERLQMTRFIKRHKATHFAMNTHFPVNTLQIMRGTVGALLHGQMPHYADAIFRTMWEDSKKMDDPAVIVAELNARGLDGKTFLEWTQDPAAKARLVENTERSVARGSFGAPMFYVGDEPFFGKDSLRDVEDMIAGR